MEQQSQQPVNQEPVAVPPVPPTTPTPQGGMGNAGAIVAVVVIVIVIIAGALYVWSGKEGGKKSEEQLSELYNTSQQQAENDARALEETSGSNQLADIEADLSGTDTTSIDAALEGIDAELQ